VTWPVTAMAARLGTSARTMLRAAAMQGTRGELTGSIQVAALDFLLLTFAGRYSFFAPVLSCFKRSRELAIPDLCYLRSFRPIS
jgi:hypothetical protein